MVCFRMLLLGCIAGIVFAEHVPPEVFDPSFAEAMPLVQAHGGKRLASERRPKIAQAPELIQQLLGDFVGNARDAHELPEIHAGRVFLAFAN